MDQDQQPSDANPITELSLDWMFEKFSEPRMMPSEWNLSELMAADAGRNARSNHREVASYGEPQAAQASENPASEALPVWHRNPFPEPRTYPVYWDLCW